MRYRSLSDAMKERFGTKVYRLALTTGATCPNRDGTLGYGGCIFCSEGGSGEFAAPLLPVKEQIRQAKKRVSAKFSPSIPEEERKYIAYFQSFTNTYGDEDALLSMFREAAAEPGICAVAIGTRPDCLSEKMISGLSELNKEVPVWVELGLQTIHERTARRINRCYELSEYDSAMKELRKRNIHVVTHLILGLPGEDRTDMTESLDHVIRQGTWGLKLHMLNVMKGTRLASEYPGYQPFPSIEEYVDLVCDLVERTPPEVTIHRLTADCPRPLLIAPPWSYEKRTILNGINAELVRRGTCQGCRFGFPTTYSCSSTK